MKTRAMLTLEDCKRISAAAEAEAKKNNWNVCVAIVDDGGQMWEDRIKGGRIAMLRMPGITPQKPASRF